MGAGYIDRHWPPAHKETGAWPLTGLRQSFLDGSLTRLVDPDKVLRQKLVEFVESGDFGLASGSKHDGSYERLWFGESVGLEEVAFEEDVFLLTKARAQKFRKPEDSKPPRPEPPPETDPQPEPEPEPQPDPEPTPEPQRKMLRLSGTVPREVWNRLGTRILPKLSSGDELTIGIDFSVRFNSRIARYIQDDLRQILDDLQLADRVQIEVSEGGGAGNDRRARTARSASTRDLFGKSPMN